MKMSRQHAAAALAAVFVACGAAIAHGQSPAPPPGRAGGTAEGIAIHGYWTIDVRNPDGTLVSHTEFKNDLQQGGKIALTRLLQGASAIDFMYIELFGSNPPCTTTGGAFSCFIVPPGKENLLTPNFGFSDTTTSRNLTTLGQSQPVPGTVLAGTVTASRNGAIDTVYTLAYATCGPNGFVTCELFQSPSVFTSIPLTPSAANPTIQPIPVSVGQVIQVTVRLSFS